jgi:hypothetical protein
MTNGPHSAEASCEPLAEGGNRTAGAPRGRAYLQRCNAPSFRQYLQMLPDRPRESQSRLSLSEDYGPWLLGTPLVPRLNGELCAKHGHAALRFLTGGLVLQDVPMFDKYAIFDAHDIGGDPAPRPPMA